MKAKQGKKMDDILKTTALEKSMQDYRITEEPY
jgi:hypothetical protein